MRLVFLGSGAFGVPTLEALLGSHDVAIVVTQPDRPAGRGGKLRPTPVAAALEGRGVPVIKPERVNEPDVVEQIHGVEADAYVVIAYGQKLGERLLDGAFSMNLHASLLPRWRGAAPIHHAVMAGDAETGNSVITLASEMDAGDVLAITRRAIEPTQTTGELHDLLAADGPAALLEALDRVRTDTVERVKQNPSLVTLAPKLSRADAEIDFGRDGEACRAHINGLSPWPGCTIDFDGLPLKLLRAGPAQGSGAAGTLIDADAGVVACGSGAFRLLEVQPAGKKPMSYKEFARGRRPAIGTPLGPKNP